MSAFVAVAGTLKPEMRLAQAVSAFEASLSDTEKTNFRDERSRSLKSPPDVTDVMRLTAQIDRSQKPGGRCFGPRFTRFLHGIQQFAPLADILVGSTQNIIAGGVWSIVRLALLTTVKYSTYLESLSLLLMETSRALPQRYDWVALYPRSKLLQAHITEYLIVVVQICHRFKSYLSSSALKRIAMSLNDADIQEFQSKLGSWSKLIDERIVFLLASKTEEEAQENSRFRKLMINASKTSSRQQKLRAFQQVLDRCSLYDYETSWRQIRRIGNTIGYAKNTQYSKRKEDDESSTLIFTGKIGSGKSVTFSNIVDSLVLYCESESASVAYFFCRYDIPESLKARTIIGSLVRQIVRTYGDIFDEGKAYCETFEYYDMFDLLQQVVPAKHKLFLVLDGLDLCNRAEKEILAKQLENLQRKFTVHSCISLRLGPDTRSDSSLTDIPGVTRVTHIDNTADIEAFIEEELARCIESETLLLGDPSLVLDIREALSSGSQGMFLWTDLQIKSLCSLKTDEEISQALKDLPRDLSEIYNRIVLKSSLRSNHHQRRTFEIVTATHRPLTTEELREALSVCPGNTEWTSTKLINDIHSLLAGCGCLLIVDEEEDTVRFVHPSVQQFLLERYEDFQGLRITMEACHMVMAEIVVTYLSYGVFDRQVSKRAPAMNMGSAPAKIIQSSTTTSSRHAQTLALKLLKLRKRTDFDVGGVLAREIRSHKDAASHLFHLHDYARKNYLLHISQSHTLGPHIDELFPKLLQRTESRADNLDNARLAIVSAINHDNVRMAGKIIETVNAMDAMDLHFPLYGYIALKKAICDGCENVLDSHYEYFWRQPPLSYIVEESIFPHGKLSICGLAFGGRIPEIPRLMDDFGTYQHICRSPRNPLACAIWGRNEAMIKYLYALRKYPIAGAPFDRSPIWEAVRQDNFALVERFFWEDSDAVGPGKFQTLLKLAFRLNHVRIVDFLNINCRLKYPNVSWLIFPSQ